MNFFKRLLLFFKYGYKRSRKSYFNYLKKKGVVLKGENIRFHSPWTTIVDIQRPWMIEIGDNVDIAAFCKILTHGFDWAVLQRQYGIVLGSAGKVKIGNNVFIGQNTTILKGTIIEDNVIIGANSLVCKKCEANSVYAGVPAKKICTLEEYLAKREKAQLSEATELVVEYYKKYGNYPDKKYLNEFFWLFENNYDDLIPEFKKILKINNCEQESINSFIKHKPLFKSYDDFIESIKKNDD